MNVKGILDEKGREVVTLDPDRTIGEAVRLLNEHRIGAIVVTTGNGRIAGIFSERDVVRALGESGAGALDQPVSTAMTASVKICNEAHTVNEVMEIMTSHRFRHLPVERDGALGGIVSIGDVVKWRIEEVKQEADEIRNYIATA